MARMEELIDFYVNEIYEEIGKAHPETLEEGAFSIKTVWDTVAKQGYIERNDLGDTVARLAFVNFQRAVELAYIHYVLEQNEADQKLIVESSAYPHHTAREPSPLINNRGEISFNTVREEFAHNNVLQHTVLGRTETVRDLLKLGVKVIAAFPHTSKAHLELEQEQKETYATEQNNPEYGHNLITVDLKEFTADDSGATFKFNTLDDGARRFQILAQQANVKADGMKWAITYGNPEEKPVVGERIGKTEEYLKDNIQGSHRERALEALGLG